MSEPERKNCKECGGEILHWVDIAGAMESMLELPSIKPGLIPMMRQAIQEIRDLRNAVMGADRLHADTLYRGNEEAKNCYMKYRAFVTLPSDLQNDPRDLRDPDVLICPHLIQGRTGMPCPKCGEGPCKLVGHGAGL